MIINCLWMISFNPRQLTTNSVSVFNSMVCHLLIISNARVKSSVWVVCPYSWRTVIPVTLQLDLAAYSCSDHRPTNTKQYPPPDSFPSVNKNWSFISQIMCKHPVFILRFCCPNRKEWFLSCEALHAHKIYIICRPCMNSQFHSTNWPWTWCSNFSHTIFVYVWKGTEVLGWICL